MDTFAQRFSQALLSRNITAAELSRRLGVNEGTLSNYKKGTYEPKQRRLEAIATMLNVSIPWLMGADVPMDSDSTISNIIPLPKTKMVPLVGTIACGEPILADENIEEMVPMPEHINADFALRCKGDSMINARILDNDIVYIRQQETVENGEIAAVLIDNEATLKRFYRYGDTVVLRAENPNYKEFEYKKEQLNEIKILGKAVHFLSVVQ